jgi:HEAT repeat protein
MRRLRCTFAAILIALVIPVFCDAQQSGRSTVLAQMEHTIARVQASKTVNERTDAAERLASLAKKINRKQMTETTIADVISLLDSPDDSVRFWVATALGNLGPCAKAAIPKLEELLPKADCLDGAITSASGIRYALKQMGGSPLPRPNCTPIAG